MPLYRLNEIKPRHERNLNVTPFEFGFRLKLFAFNLQPFPKVDVWKKKKGKKEMGIETADEHFYRINLQRATVVYRANETSIEKRIPFPTSSLRDHRLRRT